MQERFRPRLSSAQQNIRVKKSLRHKLHKTSTRIPWRRRQWVHPKPHSVTVTVTLPTFCPIQSICDYPCRAVLRRLPNTARGSVLCHESVCLSVCSTHMPMNIAHRIFRFWTMRNMAAGTATVWAVRGSRPALGVHPASCTTGIGSLSRGWSGQSVELTTHPHLEPRLRMSGYIALLHPCLHDVLPLPLHPKIHTHTHTHMFFGQRHPVVLASHE